MFLQYRGPAFEAADYADKLLDRLNARSEEYVKDSPKRPIRKVGPSDWTRKVVTDFLILNPMATDVQVAAKMLVSINEVRSIRESIRASELTALSTVNISPVESHTVGNLNTYHLVKCPHCPNKVRQDRLAKHLSKVHKKSL